MSNLKLGVAVSTCLILAVPTLAQSRILSGPRCPCWEVADLARTVAAAEEVARSVQDPETAIGCVLEGVSGAGLSLIIDIQNQEKPDLTCPSRFTTGVSTLASERERRIVFECSGGNAIPVGTTCESSTEGGLKFLQSTRQLESCEALIEEYYRLVKTVGEQTGFTCPRR